MATNLTSVSANLTPLAQQVYEVPSGKVAIALATVFNTVGDEVIAVNMYKETSGGGTFRLVPLNTNVYPNIDGYRPPLDKVILLAGDKVFASAGSVTKTARATGLFGLPVMLDPLQQEAGADFSLSVAERDTV